ncbi:MAG: DUF1501 domain-containing protein [Planctomycetes bacterium]|nr:DUF1501 domain-containing protein [Planctomycetota bacterium]MBI3843963.1 DUF1501 domain-containing protein [Planctomycetota bacterium]
MTHPSTSIQTRREFLGTGLALIGFGATVPSFVDKLAWAIGSPDDAPLTASKPGVPEERVLVIVQLAGGNDGLNTVVPFEDDVYYKSRPRIAIAKKDVLRLDARVGLHPSAADLKRLFDDAKLAIVQGVGYPNPNRSHFTSTDIWETASPDGREHRGWIGRYFDCSCKGADPCPPENAIALSPTAPLALQGDRFQPIAFNDPQSLEWQGGRDPNLAAAHDALNKPGAAASPHDPLAFLERVAMDAQVSAEKIRRAAAGPSPVEYPRLPFAQALRGVARLVAANLPTRVYYVSLGGFDTHSDQKGRHERLLEGFGSAIRAFLADLEKTGHLDRVLVMTFSEFGRRVAENGAGGTDHGQAAPLFVFGKKIKPGLFGTHSDLRELREGDVPFTTDFRQVYATVLDGWLRADSKAILGATFSRLSFV